ncbi:MAG: type II secretion system F family protein [Pirellulaceae bacterium]
MVELFILSLVTGVCVAGAAYAGGGSYERMVDYVHRDLDDRLRSFRAQTPHLRSWIHGWLIGVLVLFVSVWLATDGLLLAVLTASLLSAGPWYLVRRMSQIRRDKIEEQLADAMVMFSSAVRAGMSLAQAVELLSEECPKPINQEFKQIVGEYKLGKPLERTLTEAKERLKSENFVLFAAALLASRESGGRLNETVERISKSVVELQRLERKIMAETAQARKSAVYMALVPLFVLLLYYLVIDPTNTVKLFVTLPGQIMLSAALLLNLVAYFWSLRILRADF